MFPFTFKHAASARQDGAGVASLGALWQRFMPVLTRRASIGGALEHLGTLPLTAQSSLALVRLNGETLLLGITPQNITLLAKGSEPQGEDAAR